MVTPARSRRPHDGSPPAQLARNFLQGRTLRITACVYRDLRRISPMSMKISKFGGGGGVCHLVCRPPIMLR